MKYNEYEIKFTMGRYVADNSIYIGAYIIEDEKPVDYYGDVTTCIPFTVTDNEMLLDTNNCGDLISEMINQKILEPLGYSVPSGYCNYPTAKVTDKFYKEALEVS